MRMAWFKTTEKSHSKKSSNHLAILLDICGFLSNIRVPYGQHKWQTYYPTYNTWIYAKHKPWPMLKSTSEEVNIHRLDFFVLRSRTCVHQCKNMNHAVQLCRTMPGASQEFDWGEGCIVACVIIQDLFICDRLWIQNEWNVQQSCSNPLSLAFNTELNI
jgi:hypothetical protein